MILLALLLYYSSCHARRTVARQVQDVTLCNRRTRIYSRNILLCQFPPTPLVAYSLCCVFKPMSSLLWGLLVYHLTISPYNAVRDCGKDAHCRPSRLSRIPDQQPSILSGDNLRALQRPSAIVQGPFAEYYCSLETIHVTVYCSLLITLI